MTANVQDGLDIQQLVWNGSIPLQITLSPDESRDYDQSNRYLVQWPRLSYLSELLPHLRAFFDDCLINQEVIANDGWFSMEDLPLKWHYPLGLLFDLFSGAFPAHESENAVKGVAGASDLMESLPWRLTVHFTDWPEQALVKPDAEGKVFHDAFINSVKEADFLRNGTAKGIMSLSKDDSAALWKAVKEHDFNAFSPISKRLLYAQGAPLRHIPIKVYLPKSPTSGEPQNGHLRVIQSLVTPSLPNSREAQTVGTMLQKLMPTVFPSRRTPVLARPILHGVYVPLSTVLEELMRVASYPDGWLHFGISMIS